MRPASMIPTHTEELFLSARKNRIGSSDICTVAGLGIQTPLELWSVMTGKRDAQLENDAMWLGKELEPIVARMYERKHGCSLSKSQWSWVPVDSEWMIATPDYFMGVDHIVECKTTSAWNAAKWEGVIPDYAHCQVQWQMGIIGAPIATVACLIGGRDFVTQQVVFSQDIFEQLVELGERFMEFVRTDTPPEARGRDLELLKASLIPEPDKLFVPTPEFDKLAEQYISDKNKLNEIDKSLDAIWERLEDSKARMIQLMGDASIVDAPHYRVNRTRSFRKSYQVKETFVERFIVNGVKNEGE